MSATPKQTEAQRLAVLIGRYRSPHCGEAAALLLRQDETLERALEVLELIVDGEDYGKIDGLITTIRALKGKQ